VNVHFQEDMISNDMFVCILVIVRTLALAVNGRLLELTHFGATLRWKRHAGKALKFKA
jgi:hypothetical protein